MVARIGFVSAIVAVVLTVVLTRADAQGTPPSLVQFLQQTIKLNRDQMTDVTAGKPVVKILDTPDHDEVAVFGIVSIECRERSMSSARQTSGRRSGAPRASGLRSSLIRPAPPTSRRSRCHTMTSITWRTVKSGLAT